MKLSGRPEKIDAFTTDDIFHLVSGGVSSKVKTGVFFNNGLNVYDTGVGLGGSLTRDTTITTGGFGFKLAKTADDFFAYNPTGFPGQVLHYSNADMYIGHTIQNANDGTSSSAGFVVTTTGGGLDMRGYAAGYLKVNTFDFANSSNISFYGNMGTVFYGVNKPLTFWSSPTDNTKNAMTLYNDKVGIGNWFSTYNNISSTLHLKGSLSLDKLTLSSNEDATLTNNDLYHNALAILGTYVVNIPSASTARPGKTFFIKNSGLSTQNVIVTLNGSDKFDESVGGSGTLTLIPGGSAIVTCRSVSDNTWMAISAGNTIAFANPMTTLGDMMYGGSSGTATRLAGNTTTERHFLTSTGSGGLATAPAYFNLFGTANSWSATQSFTSITGTGSIQFGASPNYKFQYLTTGYDGGGAIVLSGNGTVLTPNATLHVRGFGPNVFLLENESGQRILSALNSGVFGMGNGASFYPFEINLPSTNGPNITYDSREDTGNPTGGCFRFVGSIDYKGTAGMQNALAVAKHFSPTSGNATHASVYLYSTINQTGGASGDTFGIRLNQTITSGYNYRVFDMGTVAAYAPNAAITDYLYASLRPNINASVNNQIVNGIDIAMSGSDGAFTGVVRNAIRVTGGDIAIATIGKGIKIALGPNAKAGTGTMVAGVATIANTSVQSGSIILITAKSHISTNGVVRESARIPGTSFSVSSYLANSNVVDTGDTSTFAYLIIDPN